MGRRQWRHGSGGAPSAAVDLAVTLGPLELPNPIVTASGTYGHGDEVARHGDPARLGAITAKSLSADPWPGKPAPRLHMTAAGMLNAVGLQGPGVTAWMEHDLPALRASGARVIASVWGRTVDEFAGTRSRIRARAVELAAIEVNVSCPNLHHRSEMFAHDPGATREVVEAVVGTGIALPVFAKLSPNVTDLTAIARRRRRRCRRSHPRQHGHGPPDRCRDPPPGARRRGRGALRARDQTHSRGRCTR